MNTDDTTPTVFRLPRKDSNGAAQGEVELDAAAIDSRVRPRLIKEALVMYAANRRVGTHSTKTRSDVAGSRRKMWRQKGTGRARAGHRMSPVWRGGGVAFGPHPRDYSYQINRKQRRLALRSALFAKLEAGAIVVVDAIELEAPRTKSVAALLEALGIDGRCLIGTAGIEPNLVLSVRNLPRVKALPLGDFNAEEVLKARTIVLTSDAFEQLRDGKLRFDTTNGAEPSPESEAGAVSDEASSDASDGGAS